MTSHLALLAALISLPLLSLAQTEQSVDADICTAFGSSLSDAQSTFSVACPWRVRETCFQPSTDEWACSTSKDAEISYTSTLPIATTNVSTAAPPILSSTDENPLCSAFGSTLAEAQTTFSVQCPWRIRESCDLLSNGGWACTSSTSATYDLTTSHTQTESATSIISQPTSAAGSEEACTAYGLALTDAQTSFSAECPWRNREFCDPLISGGWACSTTTIANSTNAFNSSVNTIAAADPTVSLDHTETTVSDMSTPDTSAPSTSTSNTSSPGTVNTNFDALQLQTEDVAYNSSVWSPSDNGLVYTGPNRYLLSSRNDDANLVFTFTIPISGTYRFTMRSRAGNGNDPSEPPNDIWLKVPGQEWLKAYMPRDGRWHTDAIGERGTTHSRELLTYELVAGTIQIIVSGRSQGHIIDWVSMQALDVDQTPVESYTNQSSDSEGNLVTGTGVMNTTYQPGDLLVIAHDSGPDTDDMQAIVANRMIMDAHPAVNFMLIGATQGHAWANPTAGSEYHTQSLFPDWVNAKASTSGTTSFDGASVITVTNAVEGILNNGGTVHIAEGGPSDFTAEVIRLLQSRAVLPSSLKRIRVVQHSAGASAWNQQQTSGTNLALVRSAATWVPIANGNVGGNATADFQEPAGSSMCQRFMKSAAATRYASQWAWAYAKIDDARKCDQSDSVEVLHILNDTTTKTFDHFSSRYM